MDVSGELEVVKEFNVVEELYASYYGCMRATLEEDEHHAALPADSCGNVLVQPRVVEELAA
eukprot:15479328-Alexandrium_andersonii.AAC.1